MGLIPTISHIYFHGGITFTLLLIVLKFILN
jgi:hypothetical protein